ncbi:MAG: PEP-CTERM sorting domain-containing protein, partial [Planctomycetota bacterium]
LHANFSGARYGLMMGTLSTLYGHDPTGMTFNRTLEGVNRINDDLAAAINGVVWDQVTQDASLTGVPEPASLTLLVAGLLFLKRRR